MLVTPEAVQGSLEAALAGETAATLPWTPSNRHFRRGWRRPRANKGILFGVAQGGRAARILVTLPSEAATNPK